MIENKIVYPINGSRDVKVVENIKSDDPSGSWLLDFYVPSKTLKSKSCVLLVPGGPVKSLIGFNKWGFMTSWSELLASNGITVAAMDHNYTSKKNQLIASNNIKDVIKYLVSKDYTDIVLFTFSGGGQLIDFVVKQKEIKALVLYYTLLTQTFTSLNSRLPFPVFLGKGLLDRKNINTSIDNFAIRLDDFNSDFTLEEHETGKHGFDIMNDDDRSREIIDNTLTFIKKSIN